MKRHSVVAAAAVAVILLPVGYSAVRSVSPTSPEVFLEVPEGQCVEDTAYMRYQHWDLLLDLRDSVVREGQRGQVVRDGAVRDVTIDGCWECHTSRERFCTRCHDAVNLELDCFRCHHDPTSELRLSDVVSSLTHGDEDG